MSNLEIMHWALAIPGTFTIVILFLPSPDKFAEIFMLQTAPRWYVAIYNLVRYLASLNFRAAWQPTRGNGNGNAASSNKRGPDDPRPASS